MSFCKKKIESKPAHSIVVQQTLHVLVQKVRGAFLRFGVFPFTINTAIIK
jgi:hypothetical protein